MTSQSLRDQIEAEFRDVPYPGDHQLTIGGESGRDCDETYQLLRGRTWREFPVIEFMRGDTPIPDLSPEAFHYYMPALLLASLDDPVGADLSDSLAFYLSPSSAKAVDCEFPYDDTPNYNRRMSMFTRGQQKAIIDVLREYVTRGWEDEQSVLSTIEILQSEPNEP